MSRWGLGGGAGNRERRTGRGTMAVASYAMKHGNPDLKRWVRIHDLTGKEPNTYIVCSEDMCRDDTDRAVFRLVLEHDDVVTVGQVIGGPCR